MCNDKPQRNLITEEINEINTKIRSGNYNDAELPLLNARRRDLLAKLDESAIQALITSFESLLRSWRR